MERWREIFKTCHDRDPKVKLLLVGDGDLRTGIEKKVNEYGLDKTVIFTGLRRDVPKLMKGMDCFVFPSHYEGLPVTVVEAQAADLPCYISDKITKEVQFSQDVRYLPIEQSTDLWADMILSTMRKDRTDRSSLIIEHGYDIHTTVKWLADFYSEKAAARK